MILAPSFEQYLQDKEAFLDGFIDTGSDEELFAASYIHGHLSLVAARVFTLPEEDINEAIKTQYTEQFSHELTLSISKAIDDKELVGDDIDDVNSMLARLFSSAANNC